jgi:hypothetical protein
MTIATERLVNGLLKGFGGKLSPAQLRQLLTQDVEIVAPPARAQVSDLWPAIWALAAVLERQLCGNVLIRCGLDNPLPAPSRLGPRCHFVRDHHPSALVFGLGVPEPQADPNVIVGDARARLISVGSLPDHDAEAPTPLECFVLAGLLGFTAIARLVGIPENREEYARPELHLPFDGERLMSTIAKLDGFTCVGLGQVGQAYLALLYFLYRGSLHGRRLALIDDDAFQIENGRTQLLLSAGDEWLGKAKVPYIASVVGRWGADVQQAREKITWTWRRGASLPALALLGLHDLEARRMASGAGFERLIESGVGTDLLRPRVSWHSFSGDPAIGRRLFPEASQGPSVGGDIKGEWVEELKATPGSCGWVQFLGVSATAPCLGTAAAAFALAELGNGAAAISGASLLWSQCLPILRQVTP